MGQTLEDLDYCYEMLPKVSRTFAACIRLLPKQLEKPVLIAYLLCRIADTIEDTADLEAQMKQELLRQFITSLSDADFDLSAIQQHFVSVRTDDEHLTHHCDRSLRAFYQLPQAQQNAIRPWVIEMCEGMADFAGTYNNAQPEMLESLKSLEELDSYCYFVAGTVGHLLTALFCQAYPKISATQQQTLTDLSTSFGLGLQLTNIIKDVADDAQRGWSYVPTDLCAKHGISPANLLHTEHSDAANAVMNELITRAESHLDDSLRYCCTLPRSLYRVRLFCLTPLFFAVRTLALARQDKQLLDPTHKVKITRPQVHATIRMTFLTAPLNSLVRWYFRKLS